MTAVHGERLTIRIWPISSPTHAAFGSGCLPGLGGDPSTRPGASCERIAGGAYRGDLRRFDGVNLVAKKYGLPLAAVMLMLQQAMGEEPAS